MKERQRLTELDIMKNGSKLDEKTIRTKKTPKGREMKKKMFQERKRKLAEMEIFAVGGLVSFHFHFFLFLILQRARNKRKIR